MKKILLLNPPGKSRYLRDQYCSSSAKADYYWPPIDLLVLSGILSKEFKPVVIDAIAEGLNPEDVMKIMGKGGFYAVVALTSNASKDEDFTLFEKIKSAFGIKIILNGGFLRSEPLKHILENSFIDAVITDYTRSGICGFLKGESGDISGIFTRGQREVVPKAVPAENEFSLPFPRHELFPLKKYSMPQARRYPFTCVLMSSGCPFKCRFCASSSIPFRTRSLENILGELRYVLSLGIKEVHFPDFTFTADKKHALALCRAMKEEKFDLSWDCLTRVDCFDEELAAVMKEAGCHTIQFGVESANEGLLSILGKPLDRQNVRKAFNLCAAVGIETIGFFIIGFPGENRDSIKNTISFAQELDCDYASFSVFVPDFGADIRAEVIKNRPQIEAIYGFDRTAVPVSGNGVLKEDEIWRLRNLAVRSFYLRPGYVLKRLKRIKNWKMFISTWNNFLSITRVENIARAK